MQVAWAQWLELIGLSRATSKVREQLLQSRLRKATKRWSLARHCKCFARQGCFVRSLQVGCLAAWQVSVSSSMQEKRLCLHSLNFWRAGVDVAKYELLQKAFAVWFSEHKLMELGKSWQRTTLRSWRMAMRLQRSETLSRCLLHWRAGKAACVSEKRQMARHWRSWLQVLLATRSVVNNAMLKQNFQKWRMARAQLQAERWLQSSILRAWQQGVKAELLAVGQRCLWIWRGVASAQARSAHWSSQVMQCWQEVTREQRGQTLARRLRLWRRAAALSAIAKIIGRSVLQEWRSLMEGARRRLLQKCLRAWMGTVLLLWASWQSWRSATATALQHKLQRHLWHWRAETARHGTLRKVMQDWRRVAVEMAADQRKRLQSCVVSWQAILRALSESSRLAHETFQVWCQLVLFQNMRCVLRAWRWAATAKKAELGRAFNAWKTFSAASQAQSLCRMLHGWRGQASMALQWRQIANQALQAWKATTTASRTKTSQRRLRLWHHVARASAAERQILTLVGGRWQVLALISRRCALQRRLRLWRMHAAWATEWRQIVKEVLATWIAETTEGRRRSLQRRLRLWRCLVASKVEQRETIREVHIAWTAETAVARRRALQRRLRLWRCLAVGALEGREATRVIFEIWTAETAAACTWALQRRIRLWRCVAAGAVESRETTRESLHAWRAATTAGQRWLLQRRLRLWQYLAAQADEQRKVLRAWAAATSIARLWGLKRRLRLWQHLAAVAFQLRAVLRAWSAATAAACSQAMQRRFKLWKCHAAVAHDKRRTLGAVMEAWICNSVQARGMALKCCFRVWRGSAKLSIAQRNAAASAFGAWHVQCLLRRAVILRQQLRIWRSAADVLRSLRCLAGLVFRSWHRKVLVSQLALLRQSFTSWKQAWKILAAEKKSEFTALAGWLSHVLTRRRARASLAMISWRAILEWARSDRLLMRDCFLSWCRAVDARRDEQAELRRFWWCCEQSKVKAAEAVARSAAKVFHNWGFYTHRCTSQRMGYASAVEAARLHPLRSAFSLFRAAHERRGQQRRATALCANIRRCLERHQSSALHRWQAVHRFGQVLAQQDGERKSLAFKAWLNRVSVRRRMEAGAQRLHRLPLASGFLAFLHVRHCKSKLPLMLTKKADELRLAVEGLASRCLCSHGRALLLAWRVAACRESVSSWLLRWRRSAAVMRSSRRRRCRWPLQQWRRWTEKAIDMRQRSSLARRYAARRLLQRVIRHWALAKHCGQLRSSPYVLPSFQSSWCSFQTSRHWPVEGRGRPDSLAVWSSAFHVRARS